MDLQVFWFVLLGVLLAGYAILDGFDLGVGILHPVAKTDLERRTLLNSIGPIWDGNEVWLVTFGGALFAAFPEAYATVFSGFYSAFMLLLLALIFRAVSLEFRSKVHHARWRRTWDWGFFGASLLATNLFGNAFSECNLGTSCRGKHSLGFGLVEALRQLSAQQQDNTVVITGPNTATHSLFDALDLSHKLFAGAVEKQHL